eukprot:SAG22_NODE_589_length_8828_cov_4.479895_7_plen_85_part_00
MMGAITVGRLSRVSLVACSRVITQLHGIPLGPPGPRSQLTFGPELADRDGSGITVEVQRCRGAGVRLEPLVGLSSGTPGPGGPD